MTLKLWELQLRCQLRITSVVEPDWTKGARQTDIH